MSSKTRHLGSDFDEFLKEDNLLVEAEAIAIKRVFAHAIAVEMGKRHLSKTAMAKLMQTSRSSLERLLDPENTSVTLNTMVKAAAVMNKNISVRIT